jgi:hypothetical protein
VSFQKVVVSLQHIQDGTQNSPWLAWAPAFFDKNTPSLIFMAMGTLNPSRSPAQNFSHEHFDHRKIGIPYLPNRESLIVFFPIKNNVPSNTCG